VLALDITALEYYLPQHLDDFQGPITVRKFSDGQSNPTYCLTCGTRKYVLRRKPPGQLLKSAHAVDREYRVMKALHNSAVPVAKTYHLCEDESVIGSVFYIMQFVDGRVLWDPALPDMNPTQRAEHYAAMIEVLTNVHQVDLESAGLGSYGRGQGYIDRQMALWCRQYRASETEKMPDMEWLVDNLPAAKPYDEERVSLVHGDYRLDNMIFHHDKAQVLALVDWELSTLGHPFSDLAYQCMQLRMPVGDLMSGLGGVDRIQLGIPTEQQYVAAYCERMQIASIVGWNFYLAFSFFRFAAILQGVKKRGLSGNASSTQALQVGKFVSPLAQLGREVLQS